MAKPVLLSVDDDAEVLRAIERDLRREYGPSYRVLRADSGSSALDALRKMHLRNDPVALLLADQRMPRMTGVEFLEEAIKLFPRAKRVLLTAYADTDAAINAINRVSVDYYLLKPWDPPEERLYPVLNELLEDWQASFRPPFKGMRVVGQRWSPETHRLKDFLASNLVPYQWLDIEADEEGRALVDVDGGDPLRLPVVVLDDGVRLEAPTNLEIAEKIGLRTRAALPFYDLAIVGGGPAGLAAAVYGASEGLRTVMVERQGPGGQAGTSSRIENYLGFPAGLSGADLARRAVDQAKKFGVEILAAEATGLRVDGPYRFVKLTSGDELSSHTALVATGVEWRRLDAPGVERLTGAGVYYGAVATEALAYRGEDVYIVGGANSAGQAAMYLSTIARSVTVLVRGDSLTATMSHYLLDQIEAAGNITVRVRTSVVEAIGDAKLEAITLRDATTGETETVPAASLFIMIGALPHTDWLDGVIKRSEHGFILTGFDFSRDGKRPADWPLDRDPFLLETNVPGVFAAGDVRAGSVKRVASGVGEGSIAIQFVHQYLSKV